MFRLTVWRNDEGAPVTMAVLPSRDVVGGSLGAITDPPGQWYETEVNSLKEASQSHEIVAKASFEQLKTLQYVLEQVSLVLLAAITVWFGAQLYLS
jgi:hypothetical protein